MPHDAQVSALAGGRVGGRPEEAHFPPPTTLPLVVVAHNNIIIPSALGAALSRLMLCIIAQLKDAYLRYPPTHPTTVHNNMLHTTSSTWDLL